MTLEQLVNNLHLRQYARYQAIKRFDNIGIWQSKIPAPGPLANPYMIASNILSHLGTMYHNEPFDLSIHPHLGTVKWQVRCLLEQLLTKILSPDIQAKESGWSNVTWALFKLGYCYVKITPNMKILVTPSGKILMIPAGVHIAVNMTDQGNGLPYIAKQLKAGGCKRLTPRGYEFTDEPDVIERILKLTSPLKVGECGTKPRAIRRRKINGEVVLLPKYVTIQSRTDRSGGGVYHEVGVTINGHRVYAGGIGSDGSIKPILEKAAKLREDFERKTVGDGKLFTKAYTSIQEVTDLVIKLRHFSRGRQ